jgi:hypothetical protein
MPALSGEVISTLRNAQGGTVIALVLFYDPATRLLRDSTYQTVQDGTKTGALIADNTTSRPITVVLTKDTSGNSRTVSVPAHGRALTVAQLAALNTPITTIDDLNGFTFDLAG